MPREGHLWQSTWAKGEWPDDLLRTLLHDERQPAEDETTRPGAVSRPGPEIRFTLSD